MCWKEERSVKDQKSGRFRRWLGKRLGAHLGRGLLELGMLHQQLVRGALVALDLLLLNLLHQSFLFGFQQI